MPPPTDEVRAALERILAAEAFANAGRVARLLRYVVERTLAGEGDAIKEYVLGVEVFDRSDSFDPRLDSIVRVEARRMRARLDDYYHGPGAADPVIISIPRGSYVPMFTERETPMPDAPLPAPAGALPGASMRRWLVLAAISAVIVAIALAGWRTTPATTATQEAASGGVRIAVLPFAYFSTDPAVAMLAARVTDGVTTELARLGTLSVVSRTSAAQFVSDERPVPEVAQILGADIVMEGSAVVEQGRLKVVARLVDGALDRKVWVGEYQSALDEIEALQTRIATEAGTAAVQIAQKNEERRTKKEERNKERRTKNDNEELERRPNQNEHPDASLRPDRFFVHVLCSVLRSFFVRSSFRSLLPFCVLC
jgi:adenylate cyclase